MRVHRLPLTVAIMAVSLAATGLRPAFAGPRLALFLVVDQFSFELMNRLRPVYAHGLKELNERGVSFENTHHAHACTDTCPGHATLATGVHPGRSGIVGNYWFDRGSRASTYCVQSKQYRRSPENLLVSALPDWIKERNGRSRVYTVSGKDRAAIMLGGRKPDAAFWYNKDSGRMESSPYYLDRLPRWAEPYQDGRALRRFFGTLWEPLPLPGGHGRELGIVEFDQGVFPDRFPHFLGGVSLAPDADFFLDFYTSPFLDDYVLAFAQELVRAEGLGQDEDLDLLAVSLSSPDSLGHRYGPNSPEAIDTILRIDLGLGKLLAFLDRQVGRENLLVVLSSDHGVQPFPEYRQSLGQPARRLDAEALACLQQAGRRVAETVGSNDWSLYGDYINRPGVPGAKVTPEELDRAVVEELESCPAVERVWTAREVSGPATNPAPDSLPFRNCYHPDRSPDYFLQLEPYNLATPVCGTDHGSSRDYDTHVPWLLLAPGLRPARVTARTHTVDVAPTVASLLGVPAPDKLDGADRSPLLPGYPLTQSEPTTHSPGMRAR